MASKKKVCFSFSMDYNFAKTYPKLAHFIIDNFDKIKKIIDKGNYESYEQFENGRNFNSKIYDFLVDFQDCCFGYEVQDLFSTDSVTYVNIYFFESMGGC